MITYGFLYHNESFLRWLLYSDNLGGQIINWTIGLFLTFVLLRRILRPLGHRIGLLISTEWHAHRQAQNQLIEQNKVIADRLDPNTPGGISDLIQASRDKQQTD